MSARQMACRSLIWLAFCLPLCGWTQNLLKNPGFELPGSGGIPASWQREYNVKLTGPCDVVREAHTGNAAMCLQTQEWNFQRPQFITQEVILPAEAKSCRLSAFCKGQGLVNLVLQFRKNGQPLNMDKVDMGFGPTLAPKELRYAFGLEQDYQRYEAVAPVPDGATGVLVKIGNSVDLFDRLNIWGKVYLDDAALEINPAVATPVSITPTKTADLPTDYTDITPRCHLYTQPASHEISRLVDGDETTVPECIGGLERAANVNIVLPKAQVISRLQLYVLGNVSALTVRGDTRGDGHYDALLTRADGITGAGWLTLTPAATPVRAIRIQAISGQKWNLYGFRATFAFLSELRVLVPTAAFNVHDFPTAIACRQTRPLATGLPEVTLQPVAFTPPPAKTAHFRKMVCADLWMWGVNASKPNDPLPDFTKNRIFKQTVAGVKALGVDTVEVDLTNSSCWNLMPWPSKVCNGTKENHLKALVTALHAEGFQVVVELIHNITPFETIKWHFPQEDTSRYPEMKQYPSPAFGTYFRDNWLTILDEVMACGADGVGLSSDESYYRPAFLPTLAADDPGRQRYRQRFGDDVPAREADTLPYRRWVLMRHEGICDVYGYIADALRKKYPGVYLNTMWMVPTTACSNVTENAIPWDLVAARAHITELGSDYMGPEGVRMASAANGWRKGTMLYSGNLGGKLPDLHYYGTVFWSWMYGAGSADYWRYNWIADQPGSVKALTNAYTISKELEALGAWDAKPPRKIALLSSRASLDWGQINAWYGQHPAEWDRGLEGQRGWYADRVAFNVLQQNGYAFDWLYLDHPEQLQKLSDYQVLIVPYAYAISKEVAARITAATARGAKVILFDGHQGETDAMGERNAVPAFQQLVATGKAIAVTDDILLWGGAESYTEKVRTLIDGILGNANPLSLTRYNQHIDAAVIAKQPTEQFLFVLNWEKTPAAIDLGLALPKGSYQVSARDETQWYSVTLNGRTRLSEKDLRKFRLQMAAEKPYVFYVREAR